MPATAGGHLRGSAPDDTELGERDERDHVARPDLRHLLGDVDQAVGGAQARDQPRAVAGEVVDRQPVRRFLQDAAPEPRRPVLRPGKANSAGSR